MTFFDMDEAKTIIDQNKKVYNLIAQCFATTRMHLWDDMKELIADVKNGQRILDLGCGNGRLYGALGEKNVSYVGVDFSEKQVEFAKKDFPDGDFRVAEMSVLPFADSEFERVYCIAAFHHLPPERREITAKEIARVLRPGGRLFMTNWNLMSDWAKSKVEKGKWKKEKGVFLVPWKNEKGEVLGERIYYALSPDDIVRIFGPLGFGIEKQYYSKRKAQTSSTEGDNLVSILCRR